MELLKQYIVTTGRKPRYLKLRVDNATECTLHEMVDYCQEIDIILLVPTRCRVQPH